MRGVTIDTMALRGSGIVTIAQQARGHRFTLDSILLADFCRIKPRDRVLEAGAGTGIISLLLASRYPRITVTAIELDQEAADLCRWNSHANGFSERILVLQQDIRTIGNRSRKEPFDVIVANPPYLRTGSGRPSPSPGRRNARQDSAGGLLAWTGLGKLLKNRGRFFLVLAAGRTAELLITLRSEALEPKRMRLVHAHADRPASVVLIEAVKSAAPGMKIIPPLIIHGPDGAYSKELQSLYDLTGATSPDDPTRPLSPS
ncbi:MAG TPA: methyltransferase [Nitrospirota bacterium]|nr:methyltransferase [Nitrospirota bacterium]